MTSVIEDDNINNLDATFSSLKIQPHIKWPSQEDLISVKDLLSESCNKLNAEDIVKEPTFDLFEGTHSLEINNVKLDSYLIDLSEEEVYFDCRIAYDRNSDSQRVQEDYQYTTAIIDRLVRSIITWVTDYQSLPTTVLSCQYVEYLLTQLEKPDNIVTNYKYLNTQNPYFDDVLNSSIMGICFFGAFVKKLLKGGGVFEEEDLNFNSMGLSGFDLMPPASSIRSLLAESITFIENDKNIPTADAKRLLYLIELIDCLVILDSHVTEYSSKTEHLDKIIQIANDLNSLPLCSHFPPPGCFSMRIQKQLSNQFPPKDLVTPDKNYLNYIAIAQDIKKVMMVYNVTEPYQLMQFAKFFNKNHQRHVLARALFPLIVIKEDSSLLGKWTFHEAFQKHLQILSLTATNANEALESEPFRSLLDPVAQEALNVLFEWYQNNAQNTARYRQGYNRQLLLWDSVQAQFEGVELQFEGSEDDAVIGPPGYGNIPLMPFSSWAFIMKTSSMIEFVLKGFDLEIYKPFESFEMFWFTFYLAEQLESCYQKINTFLDTRLNSIYAINKRMKKQKAGEKKEKLRKQYQTEMARTYPMIHSSKSFLKYLSTHNQIIKSVCIFQSFQFGILKSYGAIDNKMPGNSKFINHKLIHDLRFKPFSSIGVPELPTYDVFQEVLQGFIISDPMFQVKQEKVVTHMKEQLAVALQNIKNILISIEVGDLNSELITGTRAIKEDAVCYYTKLQKTIEALSDNSISLLQKIQKKSFQTDINQYEIVLSKKDELSGYFPLMDLSKKRQSRR
ncbi:similar to Saccharomyces cerevisiae YEL053C MAK10 Non-catalytic subunit of N-terminal acetyltransferase of the NatC type, required for replication of dsRNA virus [Maudiozyma saulgeensis]|uniref:Similar to Saccharomyces cerevisiae YEL053C MAK10 Non-catalytic subunit of N-terminal acetyltransferase of the NatC type, required for replication of dsRNA virus n=1 Tax=Maudiozyma saulgeensis TaxID=1789683 RepID=A0A1X7QX86_9SACH|nr:similar to Saccharomyces cerevisiae YEL053C MAK10 Non-catalytic subunit of N-terminal acetyltransferase of the NatC type, required for replication of dsRNA virus [Kazachstania saulgeensis]